MLLVFHYHAIFMVNSNVTFSEEKGPINIKILSKDQKQKKSLKVIIMCWRTRDKYHCRHYWSVILRFQRRLLSFE